MPTPEPATVLTDEEVRAIIDPNGRCKNMICSHCHDMFGAARKAEAAVLEKQRADGIVGFRDGLVLTEREVGERERHAWNDAVGYLTKRYEHELQKTGVLREAHDDGLNMGRQRFPVPSDEPEELEMHGERWRFTNNRWEYKTPGTIMPAWNRTSFPVCLTKADYLQVAEYLGRITP